MQFNACINGSHDASYAFNISSMICETATYFRDSKMIEN